MVVVILFFVGKKWIWIDKRYRQKDNNPSTSLRINYQPDPLVFC